MPLLAQHAREYPSTTSTESRPRTISIRIFNEGSTEQAIRIGGGSHVLAPQQHLDFTVDAADVGDLHLPARMIVVERLPVDDEGINEVQTLRARTNADCPTTVAVKVPLLSCRFGTTEAQVEPVLGATYQWSVEGASIISGGSTPSVLIGLGGASSALARVTITRDGCISTGAAILALRDPLQATLIVPDTVNAGEPVRAFWSYNTTETPLTQILQLPDQPAPVSLAGDVRSYAFTPTKEGTKPLKLTAALYRIGARRRAASSGTGPRASGCSYVEVQRDLRVGPPCTHPTAIVSGGGSSCTAVGIRASFTGSPPFTGRWSDGVPFATSTTELERAVSTSGRYSLSEFSDAVCAGTVTGEAVVNLQRTRLTSMSVTPPSITLDSSATIRYDFENASTCRVLSIDLRHNSLSTAEPSCVGTGSGSLTYFSVFDGGNETVRMEATGPCGTDQRSLSFLVCDYMAIPVAEGPTTFCAGGSVTIHVEIAGEHTAGPPYSEYRFYRCVPSVPGSCQQASEYTLVQRGPSPKYVATMSGIYHAATQDRLGCPSFEGGAVEVTVKSCP